MSSSSTLPPILDCCSDDFEQALRGLLERNAGIGGEVERAAAEIIGEVRRNGDAALVEYTNRFDRGQVEHAAQLEVERSVIDAAAGKLEREVADALEVAATRIREFHERERPSSWSYEQPDGTRLGQRLGPIDRVGVYAPGGKAAYPSSVLMTAIPARVAGVGEVILAAPAPGGEVNPLVLAAAALAGVDRVFTIGGAQAVAALAYGTKSVPRVDKIVGPGNAYVAAAKKLVFGDVGIDMIAGPSEVVVICDDGADPDWVAMDLFAQAEHDEMAQSIAITTSRAMADAVADSITRLLPGMERAPIIRAALSAQGAILVARDLEQAVAVSDRIAPEHLELMVSDPEALMQRVRHAGAVFAGKYSAEVLGDYCAGPNHVLPTAGTARFSSPLGVYDFMKRTSIIHVSRDGARELARVAAVLAGCEGLTAHKRSAQYRLESETDGG